MSTYAVKVIFLMHTHHATHTNERYRHSDCHTAAQHSQVPFALHDWFIHHSRW